MNAGSGNPVTLGLSLLGCLAGWLLVAATPTWLSERLPPERWEPRLPAVSAPYTPQSDVVSLVPDLFTALFVGAAACLLVEVSKATASWKRRAPLLQYCASTLLQMALALDALRTHAPDWYVYTLHFARLGPLTWQRPWPDPLPIPSPWLSLIMLIVTLALSFGLQSRRENVKHEVTSDPLSPGAPNAQAGPD